MSKIEIIESNDLKVKILHAQNFCIDVD